MFSTYVLAVATRHAGEETRDAVPGQVTLGLELREAASQDTLKAGPDPDVLDHAATRLAAAAAARRLRRRSRCRSSGVVPPHML